MPAAEHKPHQTTSNYCIPTDTEVVYIAESYGCNGIYRSVDTAMKYGRKGRPIYKVTLTWEQEGYT